MSEPTPIRDTEENVKLIYQMSAKANFKEAVGQFYDKWAEHYDEVSQLWIPRVHPLK